MSRGGHQRECRELAGVWPLARQLTYLDGIQPPVKNTLWILVLMIGCVGRPPVAFNDSTGVVPNQPPDGDQGPPDGGVDGGAGGARLDAGAGGAALDGGQDGGMPCLNTIEQVANEPRSHIPFEETPLYLHNPPVSGEHYPVWARWRIYTEVVPRGFWVHNLEHGGVVFLYRPDAPQNLVEALVRVYNAIPNDALCDHPRALLTPDPLLDAPWAVTVTGPENPNAGDLGFGYVIKGECIESEQALVRFAVEHRNRSVEQVCDDGAYPFAP